MGVPVRISECCFALLALQDVCGPIADNGDTDSIVTGREVTVTGEEGSVSLKHDYL
jgi:hypothetical protein